MRTHPSPVELLLNRRQKYTTDRFPVLFLIYHLTSVLLCDVHRLFESVSFYQLAYLLSSLRADGVDLPLWWHPGGRVFAFIIPMLEPGQKCPIAWNRESRSSSLHDDR